MNAAPQVAAAEEVASQRVQRAQSSQSSQSSQPKKAVGFSWDKLRAKSKAKSKMQIIPGSLGPDDPNGIIKDEQLEFSQQDLEFQWMMMCNRMPQYLSGIAARMKNMNPVIKEMPHVEVVVDNQLALDQMTEIKGSILSTLRIYLHNNAITLDMRIAEQKERVRILTRKEQYELMEKENPAIAKLRDLLDLELA
jgi:DNA polymerase-3 subunit gamma/tau